MSKKEKIGIMAASLFVFIALFDRLIISPVGKKLNQLNQEIKISEIQLGMSLRNLNQKDAIASQYSKFSQYLKNPGSEEETTASLLSEIEKLARKSNINLSGLRAQQSKDKGFYREYSVEVEAEGTMDAMINFLYQLNVSTQLLRTEKLRFNLKDKNSPLVQASILITRISSNL